MTSRVHTTVAVITTKVQSEQLILPCGDSKILCTVVASVLTCVAIPLPAVVALILLPSVPPPVNSPQTLRWKQILMHSCTLYQSNSQEDHRTMDSTGDSQTAVPQGEAVTLL